MGSLDAATTSGVPLSIPQAEALLVLVGGMAIVLLGVGIFLSVLLIVARWMVYRKAGEAGWKAIIPIYSSYISYKICWKGSAFWVYFLTGLVGAILTTTFRINGEIYCLAQENVAFAFLGGCALTASAIWAIRHAIKMARAFDKGVGFGILILFFPYIMMLVLGFGKSEYVGPDE